MSKIKDKKYLELLENTIGLFGLLKELSKYSKSPSKNTIQSVTRIIRHMHGKYFKVVPSVAAETLANECGMSFINVKYNKSYNVAKKMDKSGCNPGVSKLFHREHISGGCKRISSHLLYNIDQFNGGEEIIEWLYENTFVILRLKSEAALIHEESKLSDIEQFIVK